MAIDSAHTDNEKECVDFEVKGIGNVEAGPGSLRLCNMEETRGECTPPGTQWRGPATGRS